MLWFKTNEESNDLFSFCHYICFVTKQFKKNCEDFFLLEHKLKKKNQNEIILKYIFRALSQCVTGIFILTSLVQRKNLPEKTISSQQFLYQRTEKFKCWVLWFKTNEESNDWFCFCHFICFVTQ